MNDHYKVLNACLNEINFEFRMNSYIYQIWSIILFSIQISINHVKGLPPLSTNLTNESMSSENDVLFISVNATEEDMLEISSRLR